ncbi:MAG: SPOR domain-containing protein, partial [Candidatus Omnitrophica bacterium]|nr:SPOR domain-containing protein [Candidatus Omnitrophota bacterium]
MLHDIIYVEYTGRYPQLFFSKKALFCILICYNIKIMETEIQGEFFEDLSKDDDPLKGSKREPVAKIQKSMFVMESKIFFVYAIFVLLALIVAYAIGVESGKRIAGYKLPVQSNDITKDIVILKGIDTNVLEQEESNIIVEEPVQQVVSVKTTEIQEKLPFTVQIIAYKDKASADKKADELRRSGETVFIIPNKTKTWYQLCL